MLIDYDHQKLLKIFRDFYNVTGISINIRDTNFNLFDESAVNTQYCQCLHSNETTLKYCHAFDHSLFEKCRQSKKMEVAICHAGLVDFAVPLFFNDTVIGYITSGQMKKNPDFSFARSYIEKYPLDLEEMERCYQELPLFDTEKIESIANIAAVLAKYILLENMLKPEIDENLQKAVAYIEANLEKDLSIDMITRNIHVSKSTLYRSFDNFFHCTINEYIQKKKIDRSVELLCNSDLSIEAVSQQLGFSNAGNYIRTFKQLKGTTPLQYRKHVK